MVHWFSGIYNEYHNGKSDFVYVKYVMLCLRLIASDTKCGNVHAGICTAAKPQMYALVNHYHTARRLKPIATQHGVRNVTWW